MRTALAAVVLAALAPIAAAQFSKFSWTLDNGAGCLVIPGVDQVIFGGGNSFGGPTTYSTQPGYDALVTVRITTIATPKGDCGDSHGFWGVAGDLSILGDCSSSVPLSFNVHAGETMVFGMQIDDSTLPGDVTYFGFNFRPFWKALGGALAGASGNPTLKGSGVLEDGEIVSLGVANAAPTSAATLVLGLSAANLPFKGGLLVPAPNVLLGGLITDATGELDLVGHWPAGLPAGFTFVAQAWIADAGGPHGFAATNAVQGFAY